ncbi:hypothetical protein SAMN02745119_03213 [Trichlorobacter thiogenes]|uniref:Uncharacterized protein n=1 Tax=Trichlorobacter thiogenes TaxID=115783 RepID=A0A1T4S2Y1_9BACT|nr:hypothetical protein [Trichlorobacter thiogenes]SKA22595.1 hypothetical protein SAMN02745119_03213 [Trichlorobacter thiogenes]
MLVVKLPAEGCYTADEWCNQKLCECSSRNIDKYSKFGFEWSPYYFDALYKSYKLGDGYALIKAFQVAMLNGIHPPVWVLQGLDKGFQKWDELGLSGDVRTLDDVLGLGHAIDFRERYVMPLYERLFTLYCDLKHYWKLNNVDIFAVLDELALDNWHKMTDDGQIKHGKPSLSTKKLYKEQGWRAMYLRLRKVEADWLSREEADFVLNQFPESARDTIKVQARKDPTITREKTIKTVNNS